MEFFTFNFFQFYRQVNSNKGYIMNYDSTITIQQLKDAVNKFVTERDWQQFHSPKNLAMALAIEAAELMEPFRFVSEQESKLIVIDRKQEIMLEVADVMITILCFCNANNIDLADAVMQKLELTIKKYPVEKSKGKNNKYTDYV
jgi:dCTP diphosphatase